MITHDFTYKFYLFRNRNPFIDINLIPFSKDCSSFSSLIGETAYRKNKTILDEIIDNVKHLLDGKIDYYDFTFVLDGKLVYYADRKRIVLEKNDALFLPPGTLRARDAGTDTVHFVSFNFHSFPDVSFPFDNYMPKCITSNIYCIVTYIHMFYIRIYKCSIRNMCSKMWNLNFICFIPYACYN